MTTAKPPTRREVKIALGITAALLFVVVLHSAVRDGGRRSDFSAFYTGGLIIRQGNGSRLYDLSEQARIERQRLNRPDFLIDNHPPFEALWFAALAELSYTKAYVLWGAINVLVWVFFQHILRPHAPIPRHPYHYFWLCSLFVPLWLVLILGHTTILLLFLFSLTFVCLKRSQDFRAGVFLGLALFKFPIVLPFALICFLRRRWRLMAGFVAVAMLLMVLSVLVVGTTGVQSYANLLIDIVRNPDNPAYDSMSVWAKMPTVKGLCATLLKGRIGTVSVNVLAAAVSVPLILFVAWSWRQEDRDSGGRSPGPMFAAALAVSLVTAPHLYAYDLTLMLLAVLLVIGSPPWSQKSRQRSVLMVIIVILYCPVAYALLLCRWQALYLLAPVLMAFALAAISMARRAELPLSSSQLTFHADEGLTRINIL